VEQPERRDLAGTVTDIRVTVGKIEAIVGQQADTLKSIQNRLDVTVLRDQYSTDRENARREYERRHAELETDLKTALREIETLKTDRDQLKGSSSAWRIILSTAIALLAIAVALLHH
jgi:hypothetical protein